MDKLDYINFEERVREIAVDRFSWLLDLDVELADLQYSFIRSMFWIYQSRPIHRLDGFVISMIKQDGATPDMARERIRPAKERFGDQCSVDDSDFQDFIHPSNRGSEDVDVPVAASPPTEIAELSDTQLIDFVMDSMNIGSSDSGSQVHLGNEVSLPPDYRYFLNRYGGHEFSDEIELLEPWPSEEHVPGSTYWVIGKYWKHADGDDLLIDPVSGEVYVYLHAQRGKLEAYAPSFSRALFRLSNEAND